MNSFKFHYSRLKTEFRYSVWINLKRNYPSSSDELQTIFIHIPKTAGTSIYQLIGYTYVGHVPFLWYKSRNSKKFNNYFKFAVVRNPWDRLVSTFFYLKKGGSNAMDSYWANQNLSRFDNFDDFVTGWLDSKNSNSWMHFVPQYKFIYDENEQIQVDYLLRFENLTEDFEYVSKRLNLNQGLPHINASSRSRYQDYYTEETRDIVARVYAKDIDLLGYSFDS